MTGIFALIASIMACAAWVLFVYAAICSLVGRPVIPGRGLVKSGNDKEKAIEVLKQDVESIRHSLMAFSDSADDWLWGPVEGQLQRLLEQGVRMTFVVSSADFQAASSTEVVRRLGAHRNATMLVLPQRPPVDLRIIDDSQVYVAYHGIGHNKHRPYWHSRAGGAPKKELRDAQLFVAQQLRTAQVYSEACLTP